MTCNHTSPGPPYPASSPAGSSETSHSDRWWNFGFAQPKNFCARNHQKPSRRPHRGLDLTAIWRRNRLQWANGHLQWPLARWRSVFFTDESRYQLRRASGLLIPTLWTENPWRKWGDMGWHKLCTMNTIAFYRWAVWMHSDTMTRSRGPLSCGSM